MTRRWTALHEPGFRRYILVRTTADFAVQIQTVGVGWTVYDLTRDPFALGLVGLSQFLPALLLILVTGSAADRFRRSVIIGLCLATEALCAAALLALLLIGPSTVWPILVVMLGFGTARAFFNPAMQSLLPNLVPVENLAGAVAINTGIAKLATIAGPLAGGLLYAISGPAAFGAAAALLLCAAAMTRLIPPTVHQPSSSSTRWSDLLLGFRYVWSEKVVLGAISLDMCAVLLGGAAALMPVFARDILHVGPLGLGVLNASPAVGGLVVALVLSLWPLRDKAGRVLFLTIAVFGVSVVIFGLSRSLPLSIAALVVMGAADMISVNVRHTLVQLWTPDQVRGRVSAINAVSIGASNEIGQFRAGIMASLIGTTSAVVLGGIATLAVVALWMRWFPQLLAVRRLDRWI